MQTVPAFASAGTSGSTLTRLPLEQRKWAIQYVSADGAIGSTGYPINFDEVYNLKGRLLTLVDATFPDPEQRKAQKDIVWQTLKAWFSDIEHEAVWHADIDEAQEARIGMKVAEASHLG